MDGTLKTTIHHGPKRGTQAACIADSDIVLTTYYTLAADFTARRSPIHEIAWFRAVLDEGKQTSDLHPSSLREARRLGRISTDTELEAHIIRRRSTTFHKTVCELSANFRWCLTGTPIQNRLEDIGALFAFTKASPFDSMATFRRFITIPFEEGGDYRSLASWRLGRLLDSVCLRRTKDLLDLPDRQDRTCTLELSREEREQYDQTMKRMARAIRMNAEGSDKKSLFGLFQALLQLRLLCNHGTFMGQQAEFTERKRGCSMLGWTTWRDQLLVLQTTYANSGYKSRVSDICGTLFTCFMSGMLGRKRPGRQR